MLKFFNFNKKKNKFLELLVQQAALTLEGLDHLKAYMESNNPENAQKLNRAEKEAYEVRRILKAFVDAQWLAEFDTRLAAYQTAFAGAKNKQEGASDD